MMGMKYLYTSICGVQTVRKYAAINYTCITIQLDFNKWMQELDRRSKSAAGTSISTKKRIIGSPSSSLPPSDCPNWAINKDWTRGIHFLVYIIIMYF